MCIETSSRGLEGVASVGAVAVVKPMGPEVGARALRAERMGVDARPPEGRVQQSRGATRPCATGAHVGPRRKAGRPFAYPPSVEWPLLRAPSRVAITMPICPAWVSGRPACAVRVPNPARVSAPGPFPLFPGEGAPRTEPVFLRQNRTLAAS